MSLNSNIPWNWSNDVLKSNEVERGIFITEIKNLYDLKIELNKRGYRVYTDEILKKLGRL